MYQISLRDLDSRACRGRPPSPARGGSARILPLMLATAFLAIAAPARADSVADFYRGKRINLVIGFGTGGGYVTYARLLARFIGEHIPGNPGVVAQNMPGAGSRSA